MTLLSTAAHITATTEFGKISAHIEGGKVLPLLASINIVNL